MAGGQSKQPSAEKPEARVRDHHALQAEPLGHRCGVHGAGAAERDQGRLAGRGAARGELGPEESRHAGLGHLEDHSGRIAGLHPESRAHLGQHRLFGGGGVQGR